MEEGGSGRSPRRDANGSDRKNAHGGNDCKDGGYPLRAAGRLFTRQWIFSARQPKRHGCRGRAMRAYLTVHPTPDDR